LNNRDILPARSASLCLAHNGDVEMSIPIEFTPLKPGHTSIGVRLNKVSWFKGAIRKIRITSKALSPEEFLTLED
jgi:hypothetical protein